MAPVRDINKHEEVLDAAIELIRRKGIVGTSFQDIADAVGIKKGSLVNYFRSKAELAELIQARFTRVAQELIGTIVARDDLGPEDKLRELLYFHAEHCALRLSSPVLVSIMQLWEPASTAQGRRQLEIRDEYESVFRDQVAMCVRKRIFRKVDIVKTVRGMTGMMSWTAFWYDVEQHGPLRSHVDVLIDICFRGLEPRPRTSRQRGYKPPRNR